MRGAKQESRCPGKREAHKLNPLPRSDDGRGWVSSAAPAEPRRAPVVVLGLRASRLLLRCRAGNEQVAPSLLAHDTSPNAFAFQQSRDVLAPFRIGTRRRGRLLGFRLAWHAP